MWVVLIICLSIVSITGIALGGDKYYEYKMKQMEEERKTTNLALTYQLLSIRPELSLEDVRSYIETSDKDRKHIQEK